MHFQGHLNLILSKLIKILSFDYVFVQRQSIRDTNTDIILYYFYKYNTAHLPK